MGVVRSKVAAYHLLITIYLTGNGAGNQPMRHDSSGNQHTLGGRTDCSGRAMMPNGCLSAVAHGLQGTLGSIARWSTDSFLLGCVVVGVAGMQSTLGTPIVMWVPGWQVTLGT